MKKRLFTAIISIFLLTGIYYFIDQSDLVDGVPKNIKVYDDSGFYYQKLSQNSKNAYNLIMKEIYSFPKKILVPKLNDTELDDVYEAILYDNTDMFFLKETCSTYKVSGKTYFYPEYTMSIEKYRSQMKALEEKESEILPYLKGENDYQTELNIHNYVISNCNYSEGVTTVSSSPYGCLVVGKASCEGYSKAIKRLLDRCGIENYFAMGETQDESDQYVGHLWNIVKINGEFYHLDATWNDNNNDNEKLTYSYFNINDELIQKTHIVEERFLGICNSMSENYYIKSNLYFNAYDDGFKNILSKRIAENANENISRISFMFSNNDAYRKASDKLINKQEIYRILDMANMQTDKEINTQKIIYSLDEKHNIIVLSEYIK